MSIVVDAYSTLKGHRTVTRMIVFFICAFNAMHCSGRANIVSNCKASSASSQQQPQVLFEKERNLFPELAGVHFRRSA